MTARLHYVKEAPGVLDAMLYLHKYLGQSGIEENLLNLISLRASQINGCAYCLDMHWKDLRAAGESEQKLSMLNAWREAPGFTDRERAALAWTEAVTLITEGHVPDEVYNLARGQFSEAELANLTLAVVAINGWNSLNIAFRTEAGNYQPAPKRQTDPIEARPSGEDVYYFVNEAETRWRSRTWASLTAIQILRRESRATNFWRSSMLCSNASAFPKR